jgi:hypothetical protein
VIPAAKSPGVTAALVLAHDLIEPLAGCALQKAWSGLILNMLQGLA